MNKLNVEESSRGIQFDSVIIDGGGLMHKVYWPTDGMVKYLVDGVEKYIKKFIFDSDVFLIFDHYKADSIKSDTRSARIGSFQRSYQLSLDRELLPMCLCLSSTSAKENLIEIISGELFERFAANTCSNRLVITSKNEVPEEVHCGVRMQRHD